MFWRKKNKVHTPTFKIEDYSALLELIFVDTHQTQCYYLTGDYQYDDNFKDEEYTIGLRVNECTMLTFCDRSSDVDLWHKVEDVLNVHCKDIIQDFYKRNTGKVILFADAHTGEYVATGWYLIRKDMYGKVTWTLKARYRVLEVGDE